MSVMDGTEVFEKIPVDSNSSFARKKRIGKLRRDFLSIKIELKPKEGEFYRETCGCMFDIMSDKSGPSLTLKAEITSPLCWFEKVSSDYQRFTEPTRWVRKERPKNPLFGDENYEGFKETYPKNSQEYKAFERIFSSLKRNKTYCEK